MSGSISTRQRVLFLVSRRGHFANQPSPNARRRGRLRFRSLAAAMLVAGLTCATQAQASSIESYQASIAEAAHRFAIPPRWIGAVIAAESAAEPTAVSHKGAMGLMQIMPETWDELRTEHGLGPDPFRPADNILAGTAYLRQMLDRYGFVTLMLAGYNAGPGRVDEHLATGRALPNETADYVAKLLPELSSEHHQTAFALPPNGAGDPSTSTILVLMSRSFHANSQRSSERISPTSPTMQRYHSMPLIPNAATSGHELFVQPNTETGR